MKIIKNTLELSTDNGVHSTSFDVHFVDGYMMGAAKVTILYRTEYVRGDHFQPDECTFNGMEIVGLEVYELNQEDITDEQMEELRELVMQLID